MHLTLLLDTDFRASVKCDFFKKYLLILRFVVFTFDCLIVLFENFPVWISGCLIPSRKASCYKLALPC